MTNMNSEDQKDDEYQFADLDAISPDIKAEDVLVDANKDDKNNNIDMAEDKPHNFAENKQFDIMLKNIMIVAGIIFALILFYKGYHWLEAKPEQKMPTNLPVIETPKVIAPSFDTQLELGNFKDKLSNIENTNNKLQTDLSMLTQQIQDLSSQLNSVSAELANVNSSLNSANNKIDEQDQKIQSLISAKKHIITRHITKKTYVPSVIYYLQAIIPGRAWLLASNGATMTVRVGTIVPGYGRVDTIDPVQGLVKLSSGKSIHFSPADN